MNFRSEPLKYLLILQNNFEQETFMLSTSQAVMRFKLFFLPHGAFNESKLSNYI